MCHFSLVQEIFLRRVKLKLSLAIHAVLSTRGYKWKVNYYNSAIKNEVDEPGNDLANVKETSNFLHTAEQRSIVDDKLVYKVQNRTILLKILKKVLPSLASVIGFKSLSKEGKNIFNVDELTSSFSKANQSY